MAIDRDFRVVCDWCEKELGALHVSSDTNNLPSIMEARWLELFWDHELRIELPDNRTVNCLLCPMCRRKLVDLMREAGIKMQGDLP